jgi:hypothetical protein
MAGGFCKAFVLLLRASLDNLLVDQHDHLSPRVTAR